MHTKLPVRSVIIVTSAKSSQNQAKWLLPEKYSPSPAAQAASVLQQPRTSQKESIDPEALKEAETYFTEQKAPFLATQVDVSKRAEVDAWIEAIVSKHGHLDGALNAAGIVGNVHKCAPVAELDDDEWHRIIAVNLTGMMYCLRAELRKIVDGGSIVNVTSIHGLKGT